MTQSGNDSPMTDDDTTSSESDSESDKDDEDDNLTEQTRGERLLEMAKEAIKAEESEHNARTRVEAPRPTSSVPRTTRQGPTTTRHRPPAAQRIGLGQDEGRKSWLSLEQVASIIQLHNKGQMGCNIVTTLLQGTEREDWDNVWKHMRVAEAAEAGNTRGPTPRVRDRSMTYGQLLFRHKKEGISGIYPMSMPGHWRVIIVSHVLRQVLLLDPFGNASEPYGFTADEIDNVQNSYSGYNVSTCPERLQTDRWNCGVWVAWVGSMWTTHVERGLEGTMDISKVIKVGLTSEGVSDINDHPSGESHNESFILRVRRQFRQRIYDDDIPQHLKDWLDHWHTPLTDVQAVSTSTHLPRSYQTVGATTSQQIDLTEDTTHTDRSGPSHLWGDINPPPSGGPPHHLPFKGGALAHTEPPSEEGEGPAPGPTGAP